MVNIRLLKTSTLAGIFLAMLYGGCVTVERHPGIPATALMVAEGSEQLAYNPSEDGEIYVYDVDAEELIYSGRVERGEVFDVDPENNRITVDLRLVAEQAMDEGNTHRIFFEPEM